MTDQDIGRLDERESRRFLDVFKVTYESSCEKIGPLYFLDRLSHLSGLSLQRLIDYSRSMIGNGVYFADILSICHCTYMMIQYCHLLGFSNPDYDEIEAAIQYRASNVKEC